MGEIMWHRRDHFAWSKIGRTQCARRVRAKDGAHQTRRETENTNFVLPLGECPAYSKPLTPYSFGDANQLYENMLRMVNTKLFLIQQVIGMIQ